MLTKITVETALNAVLDAHLVFNKYEQSENNNSRTGKTMQTEEGHFEIDTPCDRPGDFEPQLIKKY